MGRTFAGGGKTVVVGPYAVNSYVMEAKKNQEITLENEKPVILDVAEKFAVISRQALRAF